MDFKSTDAGTADSIFPHAFLEGRGAGARAAGAGVGAGEADEDGGVDEEEGSSFFSSAVLLLLLTAVVLVLLAVLSGVCGASAVGFDDDWVSAAPGEDLGAAGASAEDCSVMDWATGSFFAAALAYEMAADMTGVGGREGKEGGGNSAVDGWMDGRMDYVLVRWRSLSLPLSLSVDLCRAWRARLVPGVVPWWREVKAP